MARAERDNDLGSREQQRLNTPGRRTRSVLPRVRWDRDAFGKFAEGFARFMGTARFLGGMTVVIIVWVLWNVPYGPPRPRFDEYPFIFLTLVLSLQASYAAPLILLAQNRQEARDRVALEADREQTAQSRADMDFLAREIAGLRMSVGELATRDFLRGQLRAELREIIDELDDEDDDGQEGLDQPRTSERPDRRPPTNGARRDAANGGSRRDEGVRSR
ncbi:DUF1003 domain-containing protein [Microlunatus flavus]|uniref:Uncharacterized membrane protein n=1 Tax=Microlunatus flavus TaxID=1036181 RepID=A0A1H9KFN8_9ACTN|nr:Uncharacterized membrane protein [Microlunatus flavus]